MTAIAHIRGHAVMFCDGNWRTADGQIADPDMPCAKCGQPPKPEGHDACLGTIPGATAACCGHGVEGLAYVVFPTESGRDQ